MGRRAAAWIERCLWAVGLVALGVSLAVWGNSQWQQAKGRQELDRLIVVQDDSSPHTSRPARTHATLARGDLIGRIEIPRLQISTVIFEGTDGSILRDGAGHLTGSALPDQNGNVVVAAHRDSFFRPLRKIEKQDAIQLITPAGTKNYRVDSIEIVDPDRVDVVAPTRDSELTLITCYPFDWWGHAPQRFVVRARAVNESTPVAAKPAPAKIAPLPRAPKARVATENFAENIAENSASDIPTALAEPAVVDAPAADAAVTETQDNRVVRGLKKINPKRWIARLAGS